MTEVTNNQIPENIALIIKNAEENIQRFVTQRDRLTNLAQRLEKHKKTALAAEQQAKSVGIAWREKFRAADGELTKEIRELKREEADAYDFAQEYQALANELQPEFELCQIHTHKQRTGHHNVVADGRIQYSTHRLNDAAEKLFNTIEGKAFLVAIKQYRTAHQESSDLPTSAERITTSIDNALNQYELDIDDSVWSKLTIVDRSEFEAPSNAFKSFILTKRKVAELEGLLGKQS